MQHSAHFFGVSNQGPTLSFADDLDSVSDNPLCLQLRTRGVCCPQVLNVRSRRVSRESFGDIRGDRQRRLPRLVTESRLLIARETSRDPMTANGPVETMTAYRLIPVPLSLDQPLGLGPVA